MWIPALAVPALLNLRDEGGDVNEQGESTTLKAGCESPPSTCSTNDATGIKATPNCSGTSSSLKCQ